MAAEPPHTGQVAPVVRTVLEDIGPDAVGRASMHEHLLVDVTVWYTPGTAPEAFRDVPMPEAQRDDVQEHAYSFLDNLRIDDENLAVEELAAFGAQGGQTVVDLTNVGISVAPEALARISRRTGVNVVLGCGWYVHGSHDTNVCAASVEQLAERIRAQVRYGLGPTGVQPGVIGEIGMSAPPEPCERRILRAAATVATEFAMSLHVHTDNGGAHGLEHVEDCVAAGLAADRVVVGHMDERLDLAYHRAILDAGATISFDTFGSQLGFSGLFQHPTDRQRMDALAELVALGYAPQVVLGHDVFVKAHLHAYGGGGYDHLLARIVPALRDEHGLDDAVIDQLLIANPQRLLACTPPPRRSGLDPVTPPEEEGIYGNHERSAQ